MQNITSIWSKIRYLCNTRLHRNQSNSH